MTKLNRRRLLGTGLLAGAFVTTAHQVQAAQSNSQSASSSTQDLQIAQAGTAYDRAMSGTLIRACGLAVEQFAASQEDPNYDGSLKTLPSYTAAFDRYTQVASFKATQLNLSEQETPAIATKSSEVAINLLQEVFFGYALTSATHHVIALRGTQTETEWFGNISSRQVGFRTREPQYGRVHRGFQLAYEKIITQIRRTLPQLNPELPLYVTGHSLGGAVAVLTAADLAFDNSFPRNQTWVYTYASPRVGDPTFVQVYNDLLPNTFRVVNLADTVPITPPINFRGDQFSHTGQEWSFLAQFGSASVNHSIETHQTAIDRSVETNQTRTYPMSATCG